MKYDIDLQQPDPNTSHGIVLDLVGSGKRVLDVGCSTGYLARLLQERGNAVVGIEIDQDAAREAEQWSEKVVVADLEEVDLTDAFVDDRFDVVVFADVLEHLTDPTRVLRQSTEILTPGGAVIVSIPNVAHGAVRLALLEGRFEYTNIGLLDETHFRFFTRSSVESLLRSAGLVATEYRRTTADVLSTEIPIDSGHYPPDVIDGVRRSPDSTTYQFVVRAVPHQDTGEAVQALAAQLVAADQQLQAVGAQLDEIVRIASDRVRGPRIGLLSPVRSKEGEPFESLRTAIVEAELRRRLLGFEIRCFAVDSSEPSATWSGDPVHPLLPWSGSRAAETSEAVDAMVFSGGMSPGDMIDDLANEGCPTFVWGSRGGDRDLPDVLCLSGRLYDATVLEGRLEYLRLLEQAPSDATSYVVVDLSAQSDTVAASLARSLDEVAERSSAALVLLQAAGAGVPAFEDLLQTDHVLVEAEDPIDLLALVAGSDLVITDSAAMLAVTVGLRRPYQALAGDGAEELAAMGTWLADPDAIAGRPSEILTALDLARRRALDGRSFARLTDAVDLAFDELAVALRGSTGRRAVTNIQFRIRELTERVAVLETALSALRQRAAAERSAFGARAAALGASSVAPGVPAADATERLLSLEWDLSELRSQYEQAQDEIAALYATKTMRVLKPARDAYSRFRASRR